MDCKQYDKQLSDLLENEDNILFFCDTINNVLWDDYSSRKKLLDYVIDFCEKNGLDEALAWMYYYLGWHNYEFSNYDKSIELYKISKDIFIKNDNKKGLVYAYNGLIAIYCQNGQYELANELGIAGVALARELNEEELENKLLLNTSITNILAGEYDYAKEILQYIANTHDYDSFERSYKIVYDKTLAEAEINLGELDSAYKYLQRAIKINNEKGVNLFTSELNKLLGCYYGKLGQIKNAEKAFEYSCEVASENKYLFEKCEALIEWAKFKFNYGDNDKAVHLLNEVAAISNENKFYRNIKNSSILLYEHYNKIKKFKESLSNLEMYLEADREIQNSNSTSYAGKNGFNVLNREIKLYRILYDKTEIISQIGQKIISTLDIKKMITDISNEIGRLVRFDFFGISVYDAEANEITITFMEKSGLNARPPIKAEEKSSFSAYCIKNKKPIVINDIRVGYKKYVDQISLEGRGIRNPLSVIYLPLIIKEEVVGVMTIQSLKANAYDTDDVNRLKIVANYIAIALKNAVKYEKMERFAVYDSLTGFLTKREILKEGNWQAQKYKSSSNIFCIMMIDMDDFKYINDTYGHIVGDHVIKIVTQTIGKLIRSDDFIGRYGGDEFLLICPNTTIKVAYKLAEKIRKTVEATKYAVDENTLAGVTLSIGIYEYNDIKLTFSDGINKADSSMYEAKNSNKNKVVIHE